MRYTILIQPKQLPNPTYQTDISKFHQLQQSMLFTEQTAKSPISLLNGEEKHEERRIFGYISFIGISIKNIHATREMKKMQKNSNFYDF